jgi:hypothetical protein
MLRTLRRHPLLVGIGEVMVDAVRYFAVVLVLLIQGGEVSQSSGPGDP